MKLADLKKIGYNTKRAERILAMTPEERMVTLPVIGNAFSDMPLFDCCFAVLRGEYPLEMKRLAMVKLDEVTGEYKEPYHRFTDEEVTNEVAKFLKLDATKES